MLAVSAIVFVPVASRQDGSLPLSAAERTWPGWLLARPRRESRDFRPLFWNVINIDQQCGNSEAHADSIIAPLSASSGD
jgi:hypothetical protein